MHIDPQTDATRIAALLAPVIAAELSELKAANMALASQAQAARAALIAAERHDDAVLSACRAVGAAVDKLEATKFSKAEISARMSLEKSARALRVLIAKREARHVR